MMQYVCPWTISVVFWEILLCTATKKICQYNSKSITPFYIYQHVHFVSVFCSCEELLRFLCAVHCGTIVYIFEYAY